jgi:hypothetical protein
MILLCSYDLRLMNYWVIPEVKAPPKVIKEALRHHCLANQAMVQEDTSMLPSLPRDVADFC